tara:strand:- start:110 stop:934 length:825 start_codon:yes stop_codon:yes gene_type:complete
MTLPVSGAISLNQVNVELDIAGTTTISLNDSAVRGLFEVASGAIGISNGYGKANAFGFAVATNATNANLRTLAVAAGWNGTSALTCTLNSGIYFSSNAVGTAGLTIDGSYPNGVTFVNNGIVVGDGGNGGTGRPPSNSGGSAGGVGGLALLVSSAVTINNTNGTIAGGGGGGGGGSGARNYGDGYQGVAQAGGGGGGGGRSGLTNSSGGAGGGFGGGTGGVGTVSSQGSGGGGGGSCISGGYCAYGGGGGAGAAVSGTANVTWAATGTRLGAIA